MVFFIQRIFQRHKTNILRFYYFAITIALLVGFYKNLTYSLPMPYDLRNRMVGARMIENNLSPYFYVRHSSGPLKYEDLSNPNLIVAKATATPFFHSIFSLIADIPQFQMNILWMFIQYLCLAGCCLLAIFSAPVPYRNKTLPLVFILLVAFTFTTGWRVHILNGQYYIIVPFLLMGCFYSMKWGSNWLNIILFSILGAALILLRPVAIIFFLPFIFFPATYLKWGVACLFPILAYVIFVCCSPVQKTNWTDYFKAVQIHIKFHQNLIQVPSNMVQDPLSIKHFEGMDVESGVDQQKIDNLERKTETSNLYYFYNRLTGKQLPIKAMGFVGMGLMILALLPLFWFRKKGIKISLVSLFMLGFVAYDIITFCSPIARINYYWAEFLFPIMLLAAYANKGNTIPLLLLCLGIYLNLPLPPWLPAKQNIGEVLIVTALLYYAYTPIIATLSIKKNK